MILILSPQDLNLLASVALGSDTDAAPAKRNLPWDCGCVRDEEAWLCCNEKGQGRLGIVSLADSDNAAAYPLHVTDCEVHRILLTYGTVCK